MRLIHGDCLEVLPTLGQFDMIFADPPDNLGLSYEEYDDRLSADDYIEWLDSVVFELVLHAPIIWLSFNAKWTAEVGSTVLRLLNSTRANYTQWTYRAAV